MFGFLLFLAIGFTVYAVITQYKATDKSQTVPKRVWASVVAAGMSIGGYITATVMQWANQ